MELNLKSLTLFIYYILLILGAKKRHLYKQAITREIDSNFDLQIPSKAIKTKARTKKSNKIFNNNYNSQKIYETSL